MKDTDQQRFDQGLSHLLRWRLRLARFLAGFFLLLEKCLNALWPVILWAASFASLWILQIPGMFGRNIEIITALLFFSGCGFFLWRGLHALRLPKRADIIRRVEEDSNLSHRPLSGLEDRLANPQKGNTAQLWDIWKAQLLPSLQFLRLPKSRPVLVTLDPFALRGLVFIALFLAIFMAGPEWSGRLKHGLVPAWPNFVRNASDSMILWVTPPDYTGQEQIVLKGKGGNHDAIPIPEGSIVKARVKGWLGTPVLSVGDHVLKMDRLGRHSYGLETPISPAEEMTISQLGIPRARWKIAYGEDLPPSLMQNGDIIIEDGKGTLQIPLTVKDDYSVESMSITIRLDPSVTAPPPFGTEIIDQRNVMSAPGIAMEITPKFNLAWHPWAGMPVIMDIKINDHKGQEAVLEGIFLKLPERDFRHPVAQKLIALRKRLLWTPAEAAKNIAHELEKIMVQIGSYQADRLIFLSLRTMASHLYYDQSNPEIAKVIAQLWDTALRLEDGNFSMAQRNLQQAQKALQNALKDPNASAEDIAALMDEMRMAMAEYMREAFREMQKRMADSAPNMISPEMFAANINAQDIAAFMDRMQAEALSGDRNAAREMLSQMERLMEMMDPSAMQTEMPQDMQAMMEGLEQLQELIERQQKLLEETQNAGGQITPPDTALSPLVEEQKSLRNMLGMLAQMIAEKTGDSPENLGKADQAMKEAHDALSNHDSTAAIPHQQDALDNLSESQKQMGQKLAERMKQMMMMSFGMGATDPLGRPLNEGPGGLPGLGSKIEIPDKAERNRIHDILEYLRKKSGELQRPDYELDYYRRLMRQF